MLLDARIRGVSFVETVTVAHQSLLLHPAEIRLLRAAYAVSRPDTGLDPFRDYQFRDYSDRFLRDYLGVAALHIIDYSSYEGADIVHDLNLPVPDALRGRFDAVIDSGSLEHIFNFPVAVGNLMRMLKVGGSIFITTPANNLCGHGFYQFSPELMFRIFSPANGFELDRLLLFEARFPSIELSSNRRVYEVVDPASVKERVGLVTKTPVMMSLQARRIEDVEPFVRPPQQSDYVEEWTREDPASSGARTSPYVHSILRWLPSSWQATLRGLRERRRFSLSNRRFYRPR